MERLCDEDGQSLLSKMVFEDDEDVRDMQSTIVYIGMRMVKKCDGRPLALKTVAGVLWKQGQEAKPLG